MRGAELASTRRKVKRQGGASLLPVMRSGCPRMEFESPAFRERSSWPCMRRGAKGSVPAVDARLALHVGQQIALDSKQGCYGRGVIGKRLRPCEAFTWNGPSEFRRAVLFWVVGGWLALAVAVAMLEGWRTLGRL